MADDFSNNTHALLGGRNKGVTTVDDPDFTERTADSTDRVMGNGTAADEEMVPLTANFRGDAASGGGAGSTDARLADLESQLQTCLTDMREMQKCNQELLQSKRALEEKMSDQDIHVSKDDLKASLYREFSSTLQGLRQEEEARIQQIGNTITLDPL